MRGRRPRIGLALGGGSARGWAHLGVLQALSELGVPIDFVAGTSIGALVGAIYASGAHASVVELIPLLDWRRIASYFDLVFPRSGLVDGKKISDLLRHYVRETNIEDLPIPFRAVATNLATGEEVDLAKGDIIEAVRASMSFPGVFTPVRYRDSILIDGGLSNPVPVSVVREMGADLVIAVDLNHDIVGKKGYGRRHHVVRPPRRPLARMKGSWADRWRFLSSLNERLSSIELPVLRPRRNREHLPSIFEVLFSSISIMENRITDSSLRSHPPDLLLRPKLGHIRFLEFQRAREGVAAGYEEAMEKVGEWIRNLPPS